MLRSKHPLDLIGRVNPTLFIKQRPTDLGHHPLKGREVVTHRLIDEDVAVGEEEDVLRLLLLPQLLLLTLTYAPTPTNAESFKSQQVK